MNTAETDFEIEIPAAASSPRQAAPQAPEPAKAPVAPRPNLVVAARQPEPAPVPLELPSDFRAALQLVQKLQRDHGRMPNTTHDQQIAKWRVGQQLEAAKRHSAALQQLPPPPPIHECAASLMSLDQKVQLEPADGIRGEVLARLKARSR